MIAVDASVVAAFLLKEPCWKELTSYLKSSISVDHIIKEVSNTIWKACKIKKIISMDEALRLFKILNSMVNINIILEPEIKYMEYALNIALNYDMTVYDALYIALALQKNLPLLSLDERQLKVAEKLGIETIKIIC